MNDGCMLPGVAWAKLARDASGRLTAWHSLVDHCADVAACFEAVLACPAPPARLAALAGRSATPAIWLPRLCVLAALHDFGKANAGFQARRDARAPFVGHCQEALAAWGDKTIRAAMARVLPLTEIITWSQTDDALLAPLAHHGRPLTSPNAPSVLCERWRARPDYDPIAALAPLGEAVRRWFPEAFAAGGEPLPEAPEFWHAFLGLLTFADWLGSDAAWFPLADGAAADRMSFARRRAREALARIGFDPGDPRAALPAPRFGHVSPFAPRPMQTAAGDLPGRLAILESETGSGKTEAALWRFVRLFAAGEVDGLYFALPTRVAAVSLHKRVVRAVEQLWPDAVTRPRVTLAAPGMSADRSAGETEHGAGLEAAAPDATEYRDEDRLAAHWAAERPKRFFAGTIAVGTIDQALLGAVKAKHAHLRAACLLRLFLVVDEVHASDAYMSRLLAHLLRFHIGAGGHALLLSATLGSTARATLLDTAAPSLTAAVATPYPALWSEAAPGPVAPSGAGRARTIEITQSNDIGDPLAIARRAIDAARAGAKTLVVRNLRRDAVAVFRAVRELGGEPWLFACRGVATLHHGRFAREDRVLLDEAAEATLGRERAPGGAIVIGTQTLEQSLDIDADLLLTDLCPADVLLQRLGRLHRHARARPAGFETPRALVFAPADLAGLISRGAHGMGFFRAGDAMSAFPYPDLVALEATRRLILAHPRWDIPAMNRLLVESATHPEALEAVLAALNPPERWRDTANSAEGRARAFVMQANEARLRFDKHFDDPDVVFPVDETFGSRLGARDLLAVFEPPVPGPFGAPIRQIAIPDFWAKDIDASGDLTPLDVHATANKVEFMLQSTLFIYSREGLSKK
jgi:CRISPR-associated endonuclease/helicase Cas3